MFAKIPRGDIISSTNKDEYDKILLKSRINYQMFTVGKDAQNKPFRNDYAGTYNGKDIVEIRKNYTEALKNSQKRDGVRLVMTDKDGKKISSNPYVKKTDSMSKALEETQNVVKDTRSLSK